MEIVIEGIPTKVRFSEEVFNRCAERMIEPTVLMDTLKTSDVLSLKRGDEFGVFSSDRQFLITGKIHALGEKVLIIVHSIQFNTGLFALKADKKQIKLLAV